MIEQMTKSKKSANWPKGSEFRNGLVLLLLILCSSPASLAAEKVVSSSLDANWAQTSLLAEASEFLANEDTSGNAFWLFVENLIDKSEAEKDAKEENASEEQQFDRALALATPLLSDGSAGLSLLRFALALRLYSPRIQLHRQIASDLLPSLSTQKCDQNKPFYEINGVVGCALTEIDSLLFNADKGEASLVYSVDHIYGNPAKNSTTDFPLAVLYADIQRPKQFEQFHKVFANLAKERQLRYVFRHFAGQPKETPVSLSGYGVELAIKSTEYKAIDDSNVRAGDTDEAPTDLHGFNFHTLRDKHVHLRDQLRQFQLHLAEMDELAPLKQWEIADIGLQAAQQIMDAPPEEAISLLIDLAQNFPIRARTLVQTKVRQSFREELETNQQRWGQDLEMGEGESALWVNGIPVAQDIESLDLFQLFRTLRQEQRLADAFMQLGYKREYQAIVQAMDLGEEKAASWALDFREGKPEWLNNLDKDKQYSDWGNSVRLLLQPYFPGMIRPIARNLFTLVCILDPAASESRTLLKAAFSLYTHQVPIRIGFIFAVNDSADASGKTDLGVALFNVFQFVKMDKGPAKAVHFLQRIYDELGSSLDLANVHQFFKRFHTDQEVDDVFGPGSDYDSGRATGMAFFRRSGLPRLPALLVNGVPLDQSAAESPDRFEEAVLVAVMRQTGTLQRAVMAARLNDRENIQNWVLSQPDVLPRLNGRLLGTAGGDEEKAKQRGGPAPKVPPVYAVAQCNIAAEEKLTEQHLKNSDQISATQRTQCLMQRLRYLSRSDESADDESADAEPRWLTLWAIADLDSARGRQFALSALKALKKSNQMRLALVHNGETPTSAADRDSTNFSISQIVDAVLARLSSSAAKQALNKLFGMAEQELSAAPFPLEKVRQLLDKISGHGVSMEPVMAELKAGHGRQRLALQTAFVANELAMASGQRAVLLNGQLFGPLDVEEDFEPEDYALMEKLAERAGAKALAALVKEWHKEKTMENPSEMLFKMLSAVYAFAARKRRQTVDVAVEFESVLNLLAEDEARPTVEITAIMDPLSRGAQKLAPILQTLLKVLNADLRLAMNPRQRLSELPLKRFYRYVLRDEPAFGPAGQLLPNVAQFGELPQKQLLTMNLIVPDAWMVQPVWAEADLDNIRVATASRDIVARFQLRHILLEGHCFDEQSGNPPRGLQFVLGTRADPTMFDTTVMANLGYFQLKAGPGAWILRLREGKSKEIYELKGSTDAEGGMAKMADAEELEELHVLVDSFSGKTIRMRVAKRKGMEKRNLLTEDEKGGALEDEGDEDEEEQSIWSNLAPNRVVKKLSSKLLGGEKYEVINIFSLASGHLYERFLRIMMLSVLKNTRHPVKFWLLNNYLSPQFRESLPALAKHYGFDYQLIEYKWPRWLHQQTEKQRVMWGYKILFLDVLFPLDVKKIIFVDADQIVRTDMMELMELDLQGAPYGYTPFCDSRTSMDGFRFWKTGYWASHLAGRRYHISALYVVDLAKFRQIAAGDRLRGQYQGLSADPNSLSNLDQDLPNNMIHQVRIHSLPQEWLWCETWCDDSSKPKAKTIDLCNNPQTKEPKLDSAMRIVPEWTELDNEIKQVLESAKISTPPNGEEEKQEEIMRSSSRERAEQEEHEHAEL